MQKTYIVIAKDNETIQRAFIEKTEKRALKLIKDLLNNGWLNAYAIPVDCIMVDTFKLSTN